MTLSLLLVVGVVALLGAYVQTAIGYGMAFIALPILLFFLPLNAALPLVLVMTFVNELLLLFETAKHVTHRRLLPLIGFGLIGTYLGTLIFFTFSSLVLTIMILLILILFGIGHFWRRFIFFPETPAAYSILGLLAGVAHGCAALSNLVIANSREHLQVFDKERRSDLIMIGTIFSLTAILFFWKENLFPIDILVTVVFSLPFLMLGAFLANGTAYRLRERPFLSTLYFISIFASILALLRTIVLF